MPSQHGWHHQANPYPYLTKNTWTTGSSQKLRDHRCRAPDVDERNEKMQFKIRASQTSKIPYQLIVGDKEMGKTKQSTRSSLRPKETQTVCSVDNFVQAILADIANKSRVEK